MTIRPPSDTPYIPAPDSGPEKKQNQEPHVFRNPQANDLPSEPHRCKTGSLPRKAKGLVEMQIKMLTGRDVPVEPAKLMKMLGQILGR